MTTATGAGASKRRHVVVLFVDMVGSTALAERFDPELVRGVLDRYYQACAGAVTAYGGVVEKYIGDAIMAVFGVPLTREDDAERAVRAACAARDAVTDLGAGLRDTHGITLGVHCGIAAGEAIVVEDGGADLRVVGDVVNTASRLQGAAEDGEIVIGDEVARLVRPVADLGEIPPLALRGKRSPVRAWRLDALHDRRAAAQDLTPLVGRVEETELLRRAYRTAVTLRQCRLVTVLGASGIGKSRLVREFLHARAGGDGADPLVLATQCSPYGADAGYRPIAGLLESLNGTWQAIAPALDPRSVRVLRGIARADGTEPASHGGGGTGDPVRIPVAEVTRAVRALLELLAARRPVVVVVDDAHWAADVFLDIFQDVAAWLSGVPALLLCVAGEELSARRPQWAAPVPHAESVEIGPLAGEHIRTLLAALWEVLHGAAGEAEVVAHGHPAGKATAEAAPRPRTDPSAAGELCRKAARYSGGNPLFAELMLQHLAVAGGEAEVPATVQALVAARLDRLGADERDLLERAAAAGPSFSTRQITALGMPPQTAAGPLGTLVRHRVVRPTDGSGGYEFAQTLTREVAYAFASKAARAAWHLALAELPPPAPPAGPLFDGRGHGERTRHLEAACRLKREVSPDDPELPALLVRAARALVADGSRALHRKDMSGAVDLLDRGCALLPPGHPDHRVLALRRCDAAFAGGDRARAEAALDTGAAMLPDDPDAALAFRVQRAVLAVRHGDPAPSLAELRALPVAPGDDVTWCRLHQLEMLLHVDGGRFGVAEAVLRTALARARSLGDGYETDRLLGGLCELTQWSPTPVGEALERCTEAEGQLVDDRTLLVPLLLTRARLSALADDLPAAFQALRTATAYTEDLRLGAAVPAVEQAWGAVESLAGRHTEARGRFRKAAGTLREAGQSGVAFTLELRAVHELLRLGDMSAAAAELDMLEPPAAPQLHGEVLHTVLRARLSAWAGRTGEAAALLPALLERLSETDDPCLHGDVHMEIARLHRAAGSLRQCRASVAAARQMYRLKGAVLPLGRCAAEFGPERGSSA
ncbi:AAA family ATPase [Streptomyces sp. NRRL F-5123]|uniref:AAA family ATPase n=1 Tax=Streptomyces sp. NRRL F-5123 TaxID=1463856 RepID=UPI000693B074|nr:AAA family ATPase [Streptomyces sp. NRRL F-5123]